MVRDAMPVLLTFSLLCACESGELPKQVGVGGAPLLAATQTGMLVPMASSGPPGNPDSYGISCDVDGNNAVVAAPRFTGGAVYAFSRPTSTSVWSFRQEVRSPDPTAADSFGGYGGVAIDGTTLLVGEPGDDGLGDAVGAAHVYTLGGSWVHAERLTPPAADYMAVSDFTDIGFGQSAAMEGGTAVVSAPCWSPSMAELCAGAVYAYTRGATFGAPQRLVSPAPGRAANFGQSVATDGTRILVGEPYRDSNTGRAYVFVRSGAWSLEAELTAGAAAAPGSTFGTTVAIQGDLAVVGAGFQDVSGVGADAGSAFVFRRSGASWALVQTLVPGDLAAGDLFGGETVGIALSGDTLAVAARQRDSASADTGTVYLYQRSAGPTGDPFPEVARIEAMVPVPMGVFGQSVALDLDTLVVAGNTAIWGVGGTGYAYSFRVARALGSTCGAGGECASGFCADGVCCGSACPGGTSDCQACSTAAGAAADGTCGPVANGRACDDGLTCTAASTCTSGVCGAATMLACDDGNACTTDGCAEPGGCTVSTPRVGCCNVSAECPDDGDPCTTARCTLAGGSCVHDRIAACLDAGADAGPDASADGGLDSGDDGGLDAGEAAGPDAGEDAGPTGPEAGAPDTGPQDPVDGGARRDGGPGPALDAGGARQPMTLEPADDDTGGCSVAQLDGRSRPSPIPWLGLAIIGLGWLARARLRGAHGTRGGLPGRSGRLRRKESGRLHRKSIGFTR